MSAARRRLGRVLLGVALVGALVVAGLATEAVIRRRVIVIAPDVGVERFFYSGSLIALVTSGAEGHVGRDLQLWDPDSGELLARTSLEGEERFVGSSPDGARVVVREGSSVRAFDSATRRTLWEKTFEECDVPSARVGPTGLLVAVAVVGSGGEGVHSLRLDDGSDVGFRTLPVEAASLFVAPKGDLLAVGPASLGNFGRFDDDRATWIASRAGGEPAKFIGVPAGFTRADEVVLDLGVKSGLLAVSLADTTKSRRLDAAPEGWTEFAVSGDRLLLHRPVAAERFRVVSLATGRVLWQAPSDPLAQPPGPDIDPTDNVDAFLARDGSWVAVVHRAPPPRGRVEIHRLPR